MKNLPQRERVKRRARSSYSRNKKRPFLYSQELRNWHAAAKAHNKPAMQEHEREWMRKRSVEALRAAGSKMAEQLADLTLDGREVA